MEDAGHKIEFGNRFQRWTEAKFCIFSPGWNWVRILQHVYGDDRSAISALPQLYDEFCAETQGVSSEEMWETIRTRIIEKHGDTFWCPDDSETWTSPTSQR